MAWQRTNFLLKRRLNQHGLTGVVQATRLCEKAEQLYPDLFKPISFKNGCLHVEIIPKNQLPFTMIQGKLIEELNGFAEGEQLPHIRRIRLTFSTS